MGVRIVNDTGEERAALYDSVSGFAFGPTFTSYDPACLGAAEHAYAWCEFMAEAGNVDPRTLTDAQMESWLGRFHDALEQIGETTTTRQHLVRLAVEYDELAVQAKVRHNDGHDTNDDDPCPCGVSHTRAEHGYNPDREGVES